MKVLLSGSTGLVGSALVPFLRSNGITVSKLVRANSIPHPNPLPSRERASRTEGTGAGEGWSSVSWDPEAGRIDSKALEDFDAIIHLAGESIASGRWTAAKKQRIRDSRIQGTRLLARTLATLQQPPKVFLCASAVGYYGNRGEEVLREDSASGTGFLAETCTAWEAATAPAAEKGIRVVNLRFGVILSDRGGALAKMLLPFKMGLGGTIGSGNQYMSWIALEDVVRIIHSALITPVLKGPVNVTAPDAATNRIYTKTLGRVLSRPTVFPMPALAAKLAFGEMADELLLSSQRVEPRALHKSGYAFRYPDLEGALRHLLS